MSGNRARATLIAAIAAACLWPSACGGEGTDADDVVADYVAAIRAGDAAAACDLVSRTAEGSQYSAKCEPPDLEAHAESGFGEGELVYQVGFSSANATVAIRTPDERRVDDISLVVEDGEWRVIGAAEALDEQTLELVPALERAMEVYARGRPRAYAGVTPEIITALEPELAETPLEISQATPIFYVTTVTSLTGSRFSVVRDATLAKSYPCVPPGVGSCDRSGYWRESKLPPP